MVNFSPSKIKVLYFRCSNSVAPSPTLSMNNKPLPYEENLMFLGMAFDSKMTKKHNVNYLKASCNKA